MLHARVGGSSYHSCTPTFRCSAPSPRVPFCIPGYVRSENTLHKNRRPEPHRQPEATNACGLWIVTVPPHICANPPCSHFNV